MIKKIISLNLIGVLLLQISCFYTFAEFDISKEPEKVDYCRNFPKNQFGQTVDIDCAFTQLVKDQRASNGRGPGTASKVGPTGYNEIRIWNRDHFLTLGNTLKNMMDSANKSAMKYNFIGDLIKNTDKFWSLNSTKLAGEITKKVVKSEYFKDFEVTQKDIDDWVQKHAELPKYVPDITYWGTYNVLGIFFPICLYDFGQRKKQKEQAFYENLRQEQIKKSEESKRKAEVYSLATDQIISSIVANGYKGKDALVAVLDFNEDSESAQTYFTNIGLPQKINEQCAKSVEDCIAAYAKDPKNSVSEYRNEYKKEEEL